MAKELQEVWDHLGATTQPPLADVCEIDLGRANEDDRNPGECVVCEKFADEARIHESPGTAECCQGCDGKEN